MSDLLDAIDASPLGVVSADHSATELSDQIGWPPAWRTRVRSRIRSLAERPADWDSYGAGPVSLTSIEIACRILDNAIDDHPGLQYHLPSEPAVTAAPGLPYSNVQLEWESDGGWYALDVEIREDGTLEYGLADLSEPGNCRDGRTNSWNDIVHALGEVTF